MILSSWHDIPLWSSETNQTLNMIVEIPRFSQAKFEISRDKKLNPIVQDKKDQKLRYLPNVFPWHGHICNYGAFPQTWENPFHTDPWTNLNGDSDPIDVCEIGTKRHQTGSVIQVKVSTYKASEHQFKVDIILQMYCSRFWESLVYLTLQKLIGKLLQLMSKRQKPKTFQQWKI